ncbi:MAG: hypothetical protein L0229_26830 [Blastocatellia bacterium]|nr:hypothetical protein [Blastocatellia bacterium]
MRRIKSFALLIFAATFLGTGCVRKVTVPEDLPVGPDISTDELINRIDTYADITTFSAQGDVYFRNYFTSKAAKAEEYPEASQLIRLQRPENIRLRVTAPVIGKQIADMVSDGRKFRLAIYYPGDKRRFVHGSNLKQLQRMEAEDIKETENKELAEAGGLVNMRPQHITDAFLIKPTTENDRMLVFREEVRQTEPDTRPGKKNRRVDKRYYVLYVLERDDAGKVELRRKFWFDRTLSGTPLVRQQIFENGIGRLGSDVTYFDWFASPDSRRVLPGRVLIDRRNDGYSIVLTLKKSSVEINAKLPNTTFVLENKEQLEEIDLDAPRKAKPPRPSN